MANATTPQRGRNTGLFLGSAALACAAAALGGCGSAGNSGLYGDDFSPLPPLASDAGAAGAGSQPEPSEAAGVTVQLSLATPALDQLQAELASARSQNAAQLLAEHELPFDPSLGYAAVAARGL